MLNPQEMSGDVPDVVTIHPSGLSPVQQQQQQQQQLLPPRETNIRHVCQGSSSHHMPITGPLNAAVIVKTRHNNELSPSKGTAFELL